MKKRNLIGFILALFAVSAHAAPISVGTIDNIYVADLLLGSSSNAACAANKTTADCDFKNFEGTLLNDAELATVVTANPANYVVSSAFGNNASFELGFDGFDLYNGAGNDLVIFIVGNGSPFGLDVFDNNGTQVLSGAYDVTIDNTVFDNDGNWLCVGGTNNLCADGYALSAVFIDFGDTIAGDVALSRIQLSLGNSAFSLAGGFYTEAVVVPLPLSALLFSSGLALLGWIGRRKAA